MWESTYWDNTYNFKFFLGESQDLPLKSEEWNGKSPRLGSVQVKCTSTKTRTTVNRKLDKGRIDKDNDDYNEYGFDKNGSNTDGFDKDGFDENVKGNRVLIHIEDNDDVILNNENSKFNV